MDSRAAAYELQTNRTTYDTVFISDAAQYVEFDFRIQIRTSALTGSSLKAGSELLAHLVQAPRLASNFHVQSDSAECKIDQSAGKIVIYNFCSITRTITRSVIIVVSRWFIGIFEEPGFSVNQRFYG